MKFPGRNAQRFAVALLMATLLGPVGGGLAGYHPGMGIDAGIASHQMGGNDCAEHHSNAPARRAGLWSTACCDYFAPSSKIKVEPAVESSSHAYDSLPVGTVARVPEPSSPWGHLILPLSGDGRAGQTSLVILHSSLLL